MELNISLIRESFDAIKPHADEVLSSFYEVLFSNYPDAKELFAGTDMKKQRQSLAAALAYVIDGYDTSPALITKTVQKMGARHADYGTKPEHYSWVGSALLSTLAHYLDKNWTPELETEWTKLFTWIAQTMQEGSRDVAANSINSSPQEPVVKSLEEVAKDYAQAILRKSLLSELDESFRNLAREKVRAVLREALDQEAADLMSNTKRQVA